MLIMSSRNLLIAQIISISVVACTHIVGLTHFLYWRWPWFDMPAHVLGGLWAGLFAAWALSLRKMPPRIMFCVGTAFVLGIIWESFEAVIGMTTFPADILDSLKDLSMGMIGGLAAYFLARKISDS